MSAVRIGVMRRHDQRRVHEQVGFGGAAQQIGPVRANIREPSRAGDLDRDGFRDIRARAPSRR